jgi:hypothetical protein
VLQRNRGVFGKSFSLFDKITSLFFILRFAASFAQKTVPETKTRSIWLD